MEQRYCLLWSDGKQVSLCEHDCGTCYDTYASLEEAQKSADQLNREAQSLAESSRYFAIPLPSNVTDGWLKWKQSEEM